MYGTYMYVASNEHFLKLELKLPGINGFKTKKTSHNIWQEQDSNSKCGGLNWYVVNMASINANKG